MKKKNLFLAWFAGFCEAEANFNTTKVKITTKQGKIKILGFKNQSL
jgi:hypothetical protein